MFVKHKGVLDYEILQSEWHNPDEKCHATVNVSINECRISNDSNNCAYQWTNFVQSEEEKKNVKVM